LTARPEGA
jgi:hypothetical protein